ncbi:MAG: hypothetical protein AB7E36_07850 [Salinivirgaceae bacterium]
MIRGSKENWAEVPVYGSSHLDIANCNTTREISSCTYELTYHLGNVRATLGKSVADNTTRLLTATDYYPFGMTMPGRNYTLNNYRFSYQGQFAEKDEEREDPNSSILLNKKVRIGFLFHQWDGKNCQLIKNILL